MSQATLIVGDVRKVLASLPEASVDLVLTSPPFLALRSYLPAGHADKALEIGSEATPGAYIDTLLDVVEALTPVLAPHGSMVFELGDTYSGSGGAGGDYGPVGLRSGQLEFDGSAARTRSNRPGQYGTTTGPPRRVMTDEWPLDKSLCLIPELFRIALVYGQNPLTGRRTARWRARNVIRWCRPNPPVGALGDKVRPATSEMVVICRARDRYFDLDAVRTPHVNDRPQQTNGAKGATGRDEFGMMRYHERTVNNAGAPPLDHWWHDDTFDQDAWNIPTHPYAGAHYATWPPGLLEIPIEAMCPRQVCRECGQPSRRIVAQSDEYAAARSAVAAREPGTRTQRSDALGKRVGTGGGAASLISNGKIDVTPVTVGWSDCGHNNWRPGLVLDPFAGSGTTLQVATGHGRDAIGIDLDDRNIGLAEQRVGMFLSVEHHQEGAA